MIKETGKYELVTCCQSSVENGCLEVIPNKQEVNYLGTKKRRTMVIPELMPDEVPIYLEYDRCDVILINPFIRH